MKKAQAKAIAAAMMGVVLFLTSCGAKMTQRQREVREYITSMESLVAKAEKAGKKGNEKALEKMSALKDALDEKGGVLESVMDEKDKAWKNILAARYADAESKAAEIRASKESKKQGGKGKDAAASESTSSKKSSQSNANPASDFRYDLNKDGIGIVIQTYLNSDRSVTIPDTIEDTPVVEIANGVFFNDKDGRGMDYVYVPRSVVKVGDNALRKTNKVDIDLSKIEEAGASAFRESTIVYKSAQEGDVAFARMKAIGGSAFRDGVITIDGKSAADINLATVQSMGAFAFRGASLSGKMTVYKNCKYGIYSDWDGSYGGQFMGTKVSEAAIESGVESVPPMMFCDCWQLKSVAIPASVSSIGRGAFFGTAEPFASGSALTTITIAPGITIRYAGENAFANCTSLSLDTRKTIRDSGYKGAF